MGWLLIPCALFFLAVVYYLRLIWVNSLSGRYSTLYSIEEFKGISPLENPLLYWFDVKKTIFREGMYEFDGQGVFIFNENNTIYYQPAGIPLALLHFMNEYALTKEDSLLPRIKSQLTWLLNNFTEIREDRIVWYYQYDSEGNKAPWSSGIAQGFAISALIRASILFKEPTYIVLARKAFNQLQTPQTMGGHLHSDAKYSLWYEEDTHPSHILNGHIFALLAVYDLYKITGEEQYKTYFEQGLHTIENNISDFDLGFFTKYCATKPITCNNSYQHIHMRLFQALYKITNNVFFHNYAVKMEKQFTGTYYKFRHLLYLAKQLVQSKLNKS